MVEYVFSVRVRVIPVRFRMGLPARVHGADLPSYGRSGGSTPPVGSNLVAYEAEESRRWVVHPDLAGASPVVRPKSPAPVVQQTACRATNPVMGVQILPGVPLSRCPVV